VDVLTSTGFLRASEVFVALQITAVSASAVAQATRKQSLIMSRGTRRHAAAATEIGDDPEPSSPAQPTVSVAGFKEEFSKFTFLQSVIQKGFMLEDEAKDMYMQLTDSDDGALHAKSP